MKRRTKHFLVLEENPDDAFILMRTFRVIPLCSAYIARNSAEARAYLTGEGIYEDRLNFPFPDGLLIGFRAAVSFFEFVAWARQAFVTLPLFALTGGLPDESVQSLYRGGVREVVQKSATFDAVRELLHRLVHDVWASDPE